MPETVGHVWLPNFYCAVEMKIDKCLSNEAAFAVMKGQEVLDISPGARGKGVRQGMNSRQARIMCPNLVEIEYVLQRYAGFAKQVWEACAEYSPAVEPLEQNEAFIELPNYPHMFDTLGEISKHVKSIAGISPLYGIARCKLVARIISGILPGFKIKSAQSFPRHMPSHGGKDIGANIVVDKEKEFLAPLPVNVLWPLDVEVLSYLCRLGVGCIGEIQSMEKSVLIDMFGQIGHVIHQYSLGIDYSSVLPVFPRNNIKFSKTFDSLISDRQVLLSVLNEGASLLEKRLDAIYMTAGEINMALECSCGSIVSRKKHLAKRVSMYGGLPRICERLLKEAFGDRDLNKPVSAISVTAYGLVPIKTDLQIDMFTPYQVQASAKVMDKVLCEVQERFGSGTVFSGRELQLARRDKLLLALEGYFREEGQKITSCYSRKQ